MRLPSFRDALLEAIFFPPPHLSVFSTAFLMNTHRYSQVVSAAISRQARNRLQPKIKMMMIVP
jgi:hypothetical protein